MIGPVTFDFSLPVHLRRDGKKTDFPATRPRSADRDWVEMWVLVFLHSRCTGLCQTVPGVECRWVL